MLNKNIEKVIQFHKSKGPFLEYMDFCMGDIDFKESLIQQTDADLEEGDFD